MSNSRFLSIASILLAANGATVAVSPAHADLSFMKGHENVLLGYFGAARPQDRAIYLRDLEAYSGELRKGGISVGVSGLQFADIMLADPERTAERSRLAYRARGIFLQQAFTGRVFSQILDAEADRIKLPALADDRRVRCALHYFMNGQKGHAVSDAEAPSGYLETVKAYAKLGLDSNATVIRPFPVDWKKAAAKIPSECAQEAGSKPSSLPVRSLPATYEEFDRGIQDYFNWEHRIARRKAVFDSLLGRLGAKYAQLSSFGSKAQQSDRMIQRLGDDRAVERLVFDLFRKYPVSAETRLCTVSDLPCLQFEANVLTQVLMMNPDVKDFAIEGGKSELVMPVMGGRPAPQ